MPAIQVRDVPGHIYRSLAEQAKREHRSIAQQAVAVLARGLDLDVDPKERRRRVLERIESRAPLPTSLPDAVKLIREDRQR